MKRSLSAWLAFILPLLLTLSLPGAGAEERQWYQVRIYHLQSEEAEALFDRTFVEAVVPAFSEMGLGLMGIFRPVQLEKDRDEELPRQRYVVTALDSPEQLVTLADSLRQNEEFLQKAADYLAVEKDEAVFSRVEASLLYAFEGMPTLTVPKKETDGPRLFELRVYESYSGLKGRRKVEMFNRGEIDIFKAVGLDCLFFGQAVIAKNLPQLTYLVVYDDEAHRKEVWDRFLKHPDWEALKGEERYRDTVSKIISQHLRPLRYSPIQ